MAVFRVSGVQMPVSKKLDDNLPVIIRHIETSDCDFILFPAMSLTGYHNGFGDDSTRKTWQKIAEACRQSYVTALIGTGRKRDDRCHIQTRVYGDDGELIGTHEQLVPTSADRAMFEPGEKLRVFEHRGLRFGCLIGNDFWVVPGGGPWPDPRLSYQLGKQGAQVIFLGLHTGTNPLYSAYYEANLALRSIESNIHVCTANVSTDAGPVNCPTGVMGPDGEWRVQMPREGVQTYTYDIELDVE